MKVRPAPGLKVRDPHNFARILPDEPFELPNDPEWHRLFYVFGDLILAETAPASKSRTKE